MIEDEAVRIQSSGARFTCRDDRKIVEYCIKTVLWTSEDVRADTRRLVGNVGEERLIGGEVREIVIMSVIAVSGGQLSVNMLA